MSAAGGSERALEQANHKRAARGADSRSAMGGLSKLDLAVVVAYFAGTTAFGLYVSRRVKDTEGFFMGNRRFGKSLMVAQALTTGTRADYAIGVVGASYEIGMSGIWYQWMYIFSTPFFWLLSPIFRRMRYTTTADFFEERFSKSLGVGYSFFDPDILTYVSPDEVAEQSNDLVIGLLGRSKRDLDAAELMVIHVEDNRGVIMQ
jgi:sodium:solute symporter family protein